MQSAQAIESNVATVSEMPFQMQNVPLTFLRSGQTTKIAKVRGDETLHHHLENIGFVEGGDIRVVSEQSGNLIVEVKGVKVALDRSVASKIITCG